MKGPKRLLSVLLAASLSVWCVPAGALAEEAPGASDGAAVSGTPSADATIGSSSAADGAGTDAGTSQVATPAQPDAAVGASSAAPEAAQPAAAQPAAAGEGGAAGEGETAGDESFEGVYVISAAANSKAVLSTAGSQFYSGANVELASANGTLFQRWRIEAVGEGYYTITSVATGKVLDVANGGRTPGTNVWQCTPFGNDAQKWKIARAADGSVTLVSKLSGLALDIADGLAIAGTNIQTYTVNGAPAQRFALTSVSDPAPEALLAAGVYEICAAGDTSYALDVADASLVSGADVRLWSSNHSQAQKWYIEPDSEGYYTITSMGSGLVLDVSNGGLTPGTNVWQCTPFGNDAQKWYPKYAGDQSFSFVCKGNGLALDIADGIAESGTNVQVYTRNNSIAQRFVLTPTTYVPDDFSDLLAHFSTVSTNTFNGWYNMSRALSNFDGMVVWPGETVSFFDTCGPCGAAEGYLIAGVVGGSGYGGGICQASTTLYGAVVRAGLTIVERQNHTTPSTYVPIGQDAMVNWGSSDFRFRNDWDFPVKIVVDNYDRTLNCDIWGIQPDWYDYIDVSSWWTGSHSAAAQREYYKDGVIVATSALPNSWYW